MLRFSPRALTLVLGLAACTAETGGSGPPGTPAAVPAAAEAAVHRPKFTHVGTGTWLLDAALEEPIDLTAEQRATLEALRDTVKDAPLPMHAAFKAAFASDETDPVRLEATIAAAHREAVGPLARALAGLHGTLTKEQRATFVAALSSRDDAVGDKQLATLDKKIAVAREHAHEAGKETIDVRVGEGSAPPERPVVPPEEMRTRILEGRRERLKVFGADDFDAVAFVAPQVDLGRLASTVARMPKDKRAIVAAKLAHAGAPGSVRIEKKKVAAPAAPRTEP